jgi:predicted MFS family arabinose efflux permease
VTATPLRRNRDFMLLQAAQLLSSGGSQISAIAYPLLVLALTGSPAKAGFVAFVRLLGMALLSIPAGLAADHWSRRRLIVVAHAVRAVAIAGLAVAILSDAVAFWMIPVVAFVEGSGAALFSAAAAGALRAVVPPRQLPAAVSVVTGREAAVMLAAPAFGGALFGIARALPFVTHAVTYAVSTLALLAMRTPFQEERARDRSPLRSRLAVGFRFLWEHPFQRTIALLFALANFVGPGVLLAILIIGERQGLSGGEVGVLLSLFGAGVLVGSLLSPLVRRALPVRGVLLLELWTWVGCSVFLVWPSVYVLAGSIVPTALAIPSTDSVVRSYQLAMTPDRLLGRVESVRTTIALLIAPLGPLAAGLLLDAVSPRATIAVFAAFGLVLAVWGTLSPSIRGAPSLEDVTETRAPETRPAAAG